jgi:MFS family permease
MSWGFGSISNFLYFTEFLVGPLLGGWLSQPAQKYAVFSNVAFFHQFPYCLPSLFAAFLIFCGLTFAYFFLPETLKKEEESQELSVYKLVENEEEKGENSLKESSLVESEQLNLSNSTTPLEDNLIVESGEEIESKPKSRLGKLLSLIRENKLIIVVVWGYMMISLIFTMYDEVFPLWALTDTNAGGLGFMTNQIGTVFMLSGIYLVLFQLFIFKRLANRFGPAWCFNAGVIFGTFGFVVYPNISRLSSASPFILWPILTLGACMRTTAGTMSFTSSNILINLVAPKNAGKANGIAFSLAGIARALAPSLAGNLFAWSEINGLPYPFNFHLVFLILSIACGITGLVSVLFAKTLNQLQLK